MNVEFYYSENMNEAISVGNIMYDWIKCDDNQKILYLQCAFLETTPNTGSFNHSSSDAVTCSGLNADYKTNNIRSKFFACEIYNFIYLTVSSIKYIDLPRINYII